MWRPDGRQGYRDRILTRLEVDTVLKVSGESLEWDRCRGDDDEMSDPRTGSHSAPNAPHNAIRSERFRAEEKDHPIALERLGQHRAVGVDGGARVQILDTVVPLCQR